MAIGSALVLTWVLRGLGPLVNTADVALVYLLLILAVAVLGDFWSAAAASVAATLLYNYYFLPPIGTLTISDPANWFALAAFLVTAFVASRLVTEARQRSAEAERRATESLRLYEFSRRMLGVTRLTETRRQVRAAAADVLAREAWLVWLDGEELRGESESSLPASWSAAVATQLRGRLVDGEQRERVVPLRSDKDVLLCVPIPGRKCPEALVVRHDGRSDFPTETMLQALGSLIALALERAGLMEESLAAEVLRKSEAVKSALLSSFSHDLRTPLGAARVAATALQDPGVWADEEVRQELLTTLDEATAQLNVAVGNILCMSRIEAGKLTLDLRPRQISELITAAIERVGPRKVGRRLHLDLASEVPAVVGDLDLLSIALANLLDNAAKYSPPDAEIDVVVEAGETGEVHITVLDRGCGIAPGEEEEIFQPFRRGSRLPRADGVVGGLGLGLTIVRALVEAHGGTVALKARPGGGAEAHVALPGLQSVREREGDCGSASLL